MSTMARHVKHTVMAMGALAAVSLPGGLFGMGAIGDGQPNDTPLHADVYEQRLIRALAGVTEDKLDTALDEVEKLVQENPTFKLAQVVYADLLLAKAQPLAGFGSISDAPTAEVQDLLAEARARWKHFESHPPQLTMPEYLVQLEDSQRTAVVVDLKQSRLFLYENREGKPALVEDYYVSIGKNGAIKEIEGDKRTPVGVYFVTDFLPPQQLPDYYGAGAFPINYPNVWDQRLKKTGYGIWLHGNPFDTYSRPPRASDGCVTLSNPDFSAIKPFIDVGQTPVIIANGVRWAKTSEVDTLRSEFNSAFERWLTDWESMDTDRYLDNYSRSFEAKGKDFSEWAAYKRLVNRQKQFIDVDVSDLSIFRYPDSGEMMVVTFRQSYRSDNYTSTGKKQQYWQKEADGQWRIIYEGPA